MLYSGALYIISVQQYLIAKILFVQYSGFLYLSILIISVLVIRLILLNRQISFLKKQTHHRVKNNMQLVSSLINLQIKYAFDKNVVSELTDSKSRFSALGVLNKIVCNSEEIYQKININTLVNALVQNMINQNSEVYENLDTLFVIEADVFEVDVKKAMPLGLIINELLLFSVKNELYLPGKKIGISINYFSKKNECTFKFINNSAPINWNDQFENTLSKKIIVRLTNQLESEIKIEFNKRMEFSFSF